MVGVCGKGNQGEVWSLAARGNPKKSALMNSLRSRAVEQKTLSSPLRMAIRRLDGFPLRRGMPDSWKLK
jgi:hypothetical protein